MGSNRMAVEMRSWPPVIGRTELSRRTGLTCGVLKQRINRLIKAGFLRKAGPRSGIYYNLIAEPDWRAHLHDAIVLRWPSAVLVGPSVLSGLGIQTQIPEQTWVAVMDSGSTASLDGVATVRRNRKWFAAMNAQPHDDLPMRALTARQAIQDATQFGDVPFDPDDCDDGLIED